MTPLVASDSAHFPHLGASHPLERHRGARLSAATLLAVVLHGTAAFLLVARLERLPIDIDLTSEVPGPPPGSRTFEPTPVPLVPRIGEVHVPALDFGEIIPIEDLAPLEIPELAAGADWSPSIEEPAGSDGTGLGLETGRPGAFDALPPSSFQAGEQLTPVLLRTVAPEYPELARSAEVEGTVRFRVLVDRDGTVKETQLMDGSPMLVAAAREAVLQFRFRPAMQAGHPFAVWVEVPISFSLR